MRRGLQVSEFYDHWHWWKTRYNLLQDGQYKGVLSLIQAHGTVMLGRCHTGLESGRWLPGNHLLLGENVHLSGCWLLLGDTGYRETADCQQQFAWKMPTYLQTLSNYSLSESETEECDSKTRNRDQWFKAGSPSRPVLPKHHSCLPQQCLLDLSLHVDMKL